jgi:hypothetical protein
MRFVISLIGVVERCVNSTYYYEIVFNDKNSLHNQGATGTFHYDIQQHMLYVVKWYSGLWMMIWDKHGRKNHPRWSSGCMLNSGLNGHRFNPDQGGDGFLWAVKILKHAFLRRGSKAVGPMS